MATYTPKTSEEAVKKATGKSWREWFALLDKAGAKKKGHTAIAKLVHEKHLKKAKSGGWWSQMVTVEYERSRGLRAINETSKGYGVSMHKTYKMPVATLYTKWRRLAKEKKLVESTVHPKKTVRYKTAPKKPQVIVAFTEKPGGSRIGISVERLAKAADVEKHRAKWKKLLDTIHT